MAAIEGIRQNLFDIMNETSRRDSSRLGAGDQQEVVMIAFEVEKLKRQLKEVQTAQTI